MCYLALHATHSGYADLAHWADDLSRVCRSKTGAFNLRDAVTLVARLYGFELSPEKVGSRQVFYVMQLAD